MRQIVTGTGMRVQSAYSSYVASERFWKQLLVATPTSQPRASTQSIEDFLQLLRNILNSVLDLILRVSNDVLDFIKCDINFANPTFDVYEYKLNDVRPFDAMCPLKTFDSYVYAAFDVAGGGYSGPEFFSFLDLSPTQIMQKTVNAVDAIQKIVRANIWNQAQNKTGGPVNPATNLWMKENGPFPGTSWYDFSEFLLAFVALPAFVL
eukprot:CAMPEP_0115583724 /NCGR_PEP_ID=MMETSP0272-20121206/6319_1 /TAXON_ID=71861 /ORGANISM="Scrippsiella trochoidea, Strain CCMP3099" /LENGTH=206 /DNA_ID=CAMNT_0003018743 /DNA_START=149 /DNA_END=766 /DNA_ORIENTATION=-